ncbi:MAG: Y-family DNA polymerase [Bacteroidales bacterium]|nr:Y-family DNA polymerase [Bacteroidales bacterium]
MPEEDSFEDGQAGGRFIGVMDCNNFFVSCERVFNPSLEGRAVVVLSNNDGCAVSRSAEAKALGIKMGTPAFKIAQELESKGIDVVMCSSNYTLYADMSRRAMDVLRHLVGRIEIYSIDEAFVDFAGIGKDEVVRLGKEIVNRVRKETGLPVSVGVARSKTLAKAATRFAKKYPAYRGFCMIDSESQREKALRLLPAGDVWGIGFRSQKKFAALGISTAYDFVQKGAYWIKQNMGVCGLRTYEELLGRSVIRLDDKALKQTITTSRSFGELVSDLSQLRCAVSNFAASCAQKLRAQHSSAMYATVFLMTSVFREDLPQYYNNSTYIFEEAEDSTIGLVSGCLDALDEIYLPGYSYKKAGVTVSGIVPHGHIQQSLYYQSDYERMRKVDCLMDEVNRRYGKNRLHLAVQGSSAIFNRRQTGGVAVGEEKWEMRRERLSPNYTTSLGDVITVKAGA